jgi:hypothetical protein
LNKIAGGIAGFSAVVCFGAVSMSGLNAGAEDVSANIQDYADNYISLSVVNSAACPNSTNLILPVAPNSLLNGTMSSDCATVEVDTSNVYDYALTISGDQQLARTPDSSYYLDPVAGATASAPKVLSTDTWGWAVGGKLGFDANYIKEDNINLNSATSKWAAMPLTSQLIHEPSAAGVWSNTDSYDFYFAAAADRATPKGTYTGEVTFTISSEGLDLSDDGIVVDTDPAMIPVAYVGSTAGAAWVVADTSNGGTYDWYDYSKKIWANAVTVSSTNRAQYQAAPAGTPVAAADIRGFWTYIPRYRYQTYTYTWNSTNYPKAINIEFEDCQSDGTVCTAAGYAKAGVDSLSTTSPGGWLTHPAFTFDGKELNGFWVAKYEMTGTTTAPTILPDIAPLTNQTINNLFVAAKAMSGTDGATVYGDHGLTAGSSNTRIANNSNWGAIAYLSQSLFGVCTNMACTDSGAAATSLAPANAQKIWNNGTGQCASPYTMGRTGYGNGGKTDACSTSIGNNGGAAGTGTYTADNAYYGVNGMLASSTGNPTGIYDLAGGAWEYTLDVYNNTINTAVSGIAAFAAKYMNNYPNPPLNNTDNSIWNGNFNFTATFKGAIGHAISETGGGGTTTSAWHSDNSSSVTSTNPWS